MVTASASGKAKKRNTFSSPAAVSVPEILKSLTAFQSFMNEVGLNVKIEVIDSAQYFTQS